MNSSGLDLKVNAGEFKKSASRSAPSKKISNTKFSSFNVSEKTKPPALKD